jgi:hypothetical protein
MDESQWDAAMLAIDHQVRIKRHHGMTVMELGHPHNARVGKGHRHVAIFLV